MEKEKKAREKAEAKAKGLNETIEAHARREAELRQENTALEKSITLLKHELKEVNIFFKSLLFFYS